MKKFRILAIDPGMRNMAHCFMVDGALVDVGRADIFRGDKISVTGVYKAASDWCEAHKDMFDEADLVVVERQFCDSKVTLSACLIVIQTVVQCYARGKSLVVHAMTIKRAFNTITGAHKTNKQASVDKVRSSYPAIADVVQSGAKGNDKLDDMCDAVLMCQWLLTRSAQELHFLMDRLE
jgi:Holliday junction resolvasome RuvABC endonuclease subunit